MSSLGILPDMTRFAGVSLQAPIAGGQLVLCSNCRSMQRHPILSAADYNALYRSGTDSVWTSAEQRPDQDRVRAYLVEQCKPFSVLDIGCNTGGFILSLPDTMEKYGVEPSKQAAELATKAGVTIIADDVSNVPAGMQFDCITLIDVIEHVPYPDELLGKILPLLTASGQVVISTGNPETSEWVNKFRSRFWYSSFAEHISFPSHDWITEYSSRAGYEIVHREKFTYGKYGLAKTLVKWFLQQSYLTLPVANYFLNWLIFRENKNPFSRRNIFLPCAGIYKDHHIMCIARSKN